MSSVNKFIADASLFTAVSLFSQVCSCHYWLIGRLTVNRHVISSFHSPVLRYAVVAFHSVSRCDLYFFQCFLSVYTQYLWPISPIRPISPMQCFYGPPSAERVPSGLQSPAYWELYCFTNCWRHVRKNDLGLMLILWRPNL